jgi:hypothetical protein
MYGWLLAGALLLAGGLWLKHEVTANGQLREQVTHLEGALRDTEDAVVFQQSLNLTAQQRAEAADKKRRNSDRAAEEWRKRYAEVVNGGDAQSTEWGKLPVPPAVAFQLCLSDGHTDQACRDQMAAASVGPVSGPGVHELVQGRNQRPAR